MAARYSKLPGPYIDLRTFSSSSVATHQKGDTTVTVTQKTTFTAWIGAVWTLVIYFIASVGVAILVLVYVDGRHFNVTERTPFVQIYGGTRVTQFLPMQSDVVTVISTIIAGLKCALAAWVTSLCWYAALFLMERRGLAPRDLKTLFRYGQLGPGAYSKDWSAIIIGALLIASLAANFSSPIITGSIYWVPSNRLVRGLSIPPLRFGDILDGSLIQFPPSYRNNYNVREAYVMTAVGNAAIGWGRDPDKGVAKRVSDALELLAVNSTIENVTLPYFQVHSIRWIENRSEIPGIRNGSIPTEILHPHFEMTPSTVSGFPPGYAILVPNTTTNWSSDPLDSTVIHDTRLLILYNQYDSVISGNHVNMTRDLPPNAYTLQWKTSYYTFAWVTFSAGVGRCRSYNCVVSSPATIRNNTPIEVEPHELTFQALSMSLVVGIWLVNQNTSIPYLWDNLNDYVEAILVRSYSGAWINLNTNMETSTTRTEYLPSMPSLLAYVDHKRVYIWLGIQLLVTLLSVLFLVVQSRLSRHPLIGDTSLTAFHLDTTAISADVVNSCTDRVRKIEKQGDRLMVKVE